MKRNYSIIACTLLLAASVFFGSCKKDEENKPNVSEVKKGWITGTWKQADVTLGVDVTLTLPAPYGKVTIKAGSSMLDDPIINLLGVADYFKPTRNNMYVFNGDGGYEITGETDLILPAAGKSGEWKFEVYDAVLALFPSSEVRDPHWIYNITAEKLNLGLTVNIPGLGDAPLNLLMEKQ